MPARSAFEEPRPTDEIRALGLTVLATVLLEKFPEVATEIEVTFARWGSNPRSVDPMDKTARAWRAAAAELRRWRLEKEERDAPR
jgi:hypothetical protein